MQRTGSIQRSPFSKKHYDLILACDSMLGFFLSKNLSSELMSAGCYKLIKSCNITCIHAIDSGNIDETYKVCKKYINKYQNYKLRLNRMSIKEFISFKALMINKTVYLVFYWINKAVKKNRLK